MPSKNPFSKKVLLVAPPFIPVSKDSVAGIEQVVYSLGRSLTEQGHDVYTLAREDSEVYGTLISAGFKHLFPFPGAELEHFHQVMSYETSVLRNFLRQNKDIGVIIDRCQGISLLTSQEEEGPPVICGLDMEPKYFIHPKLFDKVKSKFKKREDFFVAVAKHVAEDYTQTLGLNEANLSDRMNIVYNGIITENFPFSETSEDYLLYLGRIREGKAPHLAINAAIETGNSIIVAGGDVPLNEGSQYEDREYFDKKIKPLLNPSVSFVGAVGLEKKVGLMQGAKAVIFPSQYKESGPLVPLESMACGTPVIAFNHTGSKEEIVDGKTGYLVESQEEMIDAVGKIGELNRKDCRKHVERNFDYAVMGKKYGKLTGQLG